MKIVSRRTVLRDLGWLAAGAISIPVWGTEPRALGQGGTPPPAPSPNDLYLIFTGSWVLSFEDGELRAVSTGDPMHTYDCNLNPDANNAAKPIELRPNLTYSVAITGSYTQTDPHRLIAGMAANKQGFIFNDKVSLDKTQLSKNKMRAVTVPVPSSTQPAAILSGIRTLPDPNTIQSAGVDSWPTAYALVYSLTWQKMTLSDQSGRVLSRQWQGSRVHFQFRVCPKDTCAPPKPCTGPLNCEALKAQEDHSHDVFTSLLGLLNFQGGTYKPAISFPTCDDVQHESYLKVDLGPDTNITRYEVGMPDHDQECILYANLHNCAASGLIVGAPVS